MLTQSAIQSRSVPSPHAGWPVTGHGMGLPALPRDLVVLQSIGARVRFTRGEMIFSEGDAATRTYRVLCGAVRLCKHLPDGRRQIVDFILEGDFFGLMQLSEYAFTAEAVNDVVVVSYPQTQIEKLSEEFASVRRQMYALLSGSILAMHDHLIMLGRQTAKERFAAFLFKLASRADAVDGDSIDLPMSRQDIADYLGLTIETVCRELSALKKARVLSVPDLHSLVIRDIDALEAVAAGEE